MANVMHKAVTVDEDASVQNKERLTQLEIENKGLRELLEICSTSTMKILENTDNDKAAAKLSGDVIDTKEEIVVPNEKQETEDDEKSGEQTPRNEEAETWNEGWCFGDDGYTESSVRYNVQEKLVAEQSVNG